MKRIYSILMVLAVVLAANASGISLKPMAHKAPTKETTASMFTKAMKVHNFQQTVVGMQMREIQGSKLKAYTPNKMRKAEGDVIAFTGTEAGSINFFESESDWYVKLLGPNDDVIYLDYVSEDFAGTFTIDNCLTNYTYYRDADYNYDTFVSTEFTVTGSVNGGYTIIGSAVGESGTTYTFDIEKPDPLQPKETVEIYGLVTDADIYDGGVSTFLVTPVTGQGVVYQLAVDGLIGEFGEKTIEKESTVRFDQTTGEVAQYDNGTINIALGDNYMLEGEADIVMSDTVEYKLTFFYQLPVNKQKEITVTNCKMDDSYFDWFGLYWYTGSNDEYTVEATCLPDSYEIIDQEFTSSEVSFSVTDNATGAQTSSLILESATQTIDEFGKPVIKATFVGQDLVKYTVDMSFKMPEEQGTKEFTFENLPFSNLLSSGAFQIMGYNADSTNYVSIAAYTSEVAGEYSLEDGTLADGYNYFYYIDSMTEVDFLKGTATVTMDEDGKINITTHLFGDDGYWYDMTITSQYEKAHKDYDCSDADVDVSYDAADCDTTFYESDGSYGYIRLINNERQDVFAMLVYCEPDLEATIPEGTYEVNETYEVPSVQPGEYYDGLYPTYYGTFDDEGYINTPLWYLNEGTVTVYNNDGEMAFEVNGKNSYDRTMHITYNMTSTGINSAKAQKAEKIRKMVKDGSIVIRKGNKTYNALGQQM